MLHCTTKVLRKLILSLTLSTSDTQLSMHLSTILTLLLQWYMFWILLEQQVMFEDINLEIFLPDLERKMSRLIYL